jgi:hypothetical protein
MFLNIGVPSWTPAYCLEKRELSPSAAGIFSLVRVDSRIGQIIEICTFGLQEKQKFGCLFEGSIAA